MADKESIESCKYCHYFVEWRFRYACYRPLLVRFGFVLPETVPFNGWCEHFKLAKRYTTKQKTR